MHLTVSAALILNDAGAVLCVKRGASKFPSTAGKWEFPGGKIEAGETPAQAAVREIREELELEIDALTDGPVIHHTYPEFSITLHCSVCAVRPGSPALKLHEHTDSAWVLPDRLWEHDFAEADRPALLWLKEHFFGTKLRTELFGRYPHFLESCTGTNDRLLALAEAGAPAGTLVLSEVQTQGRGRLGRSWLSLPGQGLLFSLLTRPSFPPEISATLSLVAGLAVAETFRRRGIDAGLKWPNDILIGDRKLCGILCEAQTSAKGIEGIIIGIGINTGAVPDEVAYRAVGFTEPLDRLTLLAEFCDVFESFYRRWETGALAALRDELDRFDCKKDQPILVKLSDTPTEGIARGIREDGALLLETPDGIQPILCGEIVQWD